MSPLSWKSINNLETIFLFTFLRNRLPKKKCGQALVKNAWCSIFYLHLLFVFSIEVLLHQIIRLTGCSIVVKFTSSYCYNVCCCIWIFYGPWNGKHTVQKRNWKPFQGVGYNLHFISLENFMMMTPLRLLGDFFETTWRLLGDSLETP